MLVYGMRCQYTGWAFIIRDGVLVFGMGVSVRNGVLVHGMGC